MDKKEITAILQDLKAVQRQIERLKEQETHLERQRYLKLIDAELLDALHNLKNLLRQFD